MYYCETWSKSQRGGLRSKANKQQKFYGYMASLAYKDQKTRAKGLAKHGFILDTKLSNPDIMVAYNPNTKEVVHSMAGSRFTDKSKYKGSQNRFRDIRSDLGIIVGTDRLGRRTKEMTNVVKQSQKKYGKDHNYTNTGHSLGSRVSMNVSKKLGIDHVGFNQGSSPMGAITDRLAALFNRDKEATRINYTTGTDFISKSSQLLDNVETNVVKPKEGVDASSLAGRHSISHFTGQDGSGAAIAYETYKQLAKKYKIRLTFTKDGKRVYKSSKELQKDIYKHESGQRRTDV